MPNQVRVGVGVTGAKAAASEMDQLKAKFTGLQKVSAKGFAIGAGVAVTGMAFQAVGRAIGAVTDLIGESKDAFIADERSQVQLRTALRANVDGWDENTDAIERVLEARMKLGFSDDEQRESLQGLVGAYQDVTKALEVERLAMDLARFSGVDLAQASDVLIKVHAGSYRALKQLGISTTGIKNETQALAAIQRVAAGQAEDYADTLEGRLAVSATRTAEAMEHLGQTTAEFSADFEEAKAHGIETFVTGLDYLADSINFTNQKIERQIELLRINAYMTDGATREALLLQAAELEAGHAADVHARALGRSGLGGAVEKLADSFRTAKRPGADLTSVLRELGYKAGDAEKAVDDLAGTIEDELFGNAINAGNIAQLQETYDGLIKDRDAAKKGSREYKILTGEIAENRKALFDLHLEQAEKEGPQAVLRFLDREIKKLDRSDDEARAYLETLRKLYAMMGRFSDLGVISFGRFSGKTIPGFASGVKNFGGGMAVVGEEGPELVNLPKGSDVIPSGGGSVTPTSGAATININVTGAALSPAMSAQFAREAGPAIADYLKRRGLLVA